MPTSLLTCHYSLRAQLERVPDTLRKQNHTGILGGGRPQEYTYSVLTEHKNNKEQTGENIESPPLYIFNVLQTSEGE